MVQDVSEGVLWGVIIWVVAVHTKDATGVTR